jgi:regulator of protease activity HflC (stomatin/prohibitin superfamily)
MTKSTWIGMVVTLAVASLLFVLVIGSPVRPFDRPEYAEIDTSESAFLIPLEGDTANQAAFQSVQFLEQKKVATKRIQITHRWSQTGRWLNQGEWIPNVRLIKVDRRPVTREWTQSAHTGTSSRNEAISVESRDSVNFSMGISCTANIPEDMAAVFLYSYPSQSLAQMMDSEVRARIQQAVAIEAARYDLDLVRSKKNDIMKAVQEDIVPFFKKKGIEITTIAMQGGLTYDNPEVQRAIDDAAKASQLKVAAEARRAAQEVDNKTVRLAAEGRALASKLEAQAKAEAAVARAEAEAKARIRAAEAEADAIKKVAEARAYEVEKAGPTPLAYFQLKWLEAEAQKWKQWDGKYPTYLTQVGASDAATSLQLRPPAPPELVRNTVQADARAPVSRPQGP